jgi:hypothetical protein
MKRAAFAAVLGCVLALFAACGREDIPLDTDDDAGEDGEAFLDLDASDAQE